MIKRLCLTGFVYATLAISNPVWAMEKDEPDQSLSASRTRTSSDSTHPEANISIDQSPKDVWLLSFDGGGMHGLIHAMILAEIEKTLTAHFSMDQYRAHIKIADFFDYMAGTSAGSVIAAGCLAPDDTDIFTPKFSAHTFVDFYTNIGPKIFPQERDQKNMDSKEPKYSEIPLEDALQTQFKTPQGHLKFNQTVNGKGLLVGAVALDKKKPFFFFTSDDPETNNYAVWEGLRASTATPTFFKGFKLGERCLFDGAIIENNPSGRAYFLCRRRYGPQAKIHVVSLGISRNSQPFSHLENSMPNYAMQNLEIKIRIQNTASSPVEAMDNFLQAKMIESYCRLQADLDAPVLDDSSVETLQKLKESAAQLMKTPEFDHLVKRLINIGEQRLREIDLKIARGGDCLDLSLHNITGVPMTTLMNKLNGPNNHLSTLNLVRCRLSPDMLKPICKALEATKTLTSLDLSENGLGSDLSLVHIQKLLEQTTTLKTLSLRQNGFVDRENEGYEGLLIKSDSNPTSLTALNFSHNHITDKTFMQMVSQGLDRLNDTPLKALNLTGNPIGTPDNKGQIALTLQTVKEKFQGLTISMD